MSTEPDHSPQLEDQRQGFPLSACKHEATAPAEDQVAPPGDDGDDGPAMQVLDAIGDPLSPDGVSATERFGILTSPVPLEGRSADPETAYASLRTEFPWMAEANARIGAAIALSKMGQGWFRTRPLLLVGPPGVGKTRWARRVAEIVHTPFAWISFAGLNNSMLITGSDRGWATGRPGLAAMMIAQFHVANPVLLIDEVDKAAGGSQNGDPVSALLPLLESETARQFADNYLLGNLDLSAVSWILTANSIDGLPNALLSRVAVLRTPRPSEREAMRTVPLMVNDVARSYGIDPGKMPDLKDALPGFSRRYKESPCLRDLREAVEAEVIGRIWSPPGPRLNLP